MPECCACGLKGFAQYHIIIRMGEGIAADDAKYAEVDLNEPDYNMGSEGMKWFRDLFCKTPRVRSVTDSWS